MVSYENFYEFIDENTIGRFFGTALEDICWLLFLYLGVWSNWHEWGKCQFVTVPWIGSFYFFDFLLI